MNWQFVFSALAFGVAAIVALLTATNVLPASTRIIDAWSMTRPTIPRRWLIMAFWCTYALPLAGCGILVGTAGQVLSAIWNDVAQLLFWLALGIDAVIGQRRFILALSVVFLAFSAYAVATHL